MFNLRITGTCLHTRSRIYGSVTLSLVVHALPTLRVGLKPAHSSVLPSLSATTIKLFNICAENGRVVIYSDAAKVYTIYIQSSQFSASQYASTTTIRCPISVWPWRTSIDTRCYLASLQSSGAQACTPPAFNTSEREVNTDPDSRPPAVGACSDTVTAGQSGAGYGCEQRCRS